MLEIKKSFSDIEKLLDKNALENFIACNYRDIIGYHFCLGIWIRNNLLKESSRLYQLFKLAGIEEKDNMSSLIMQMFYLNLQMQYK